MIEHANPQGGYEICVPPIGLAGSLQIPKEPYALVGRLFNAAFDRSKASEDEIGRDIHRLGTVNKHLENGDDDDE